MIAGKSARSVASSARMAVSSARRSPRISPDPLSIRSPADAAARQDYAKLIEGTIDWVNAHGRFEIPRRKEALLGVLQHAVSQLLEPGPSHGPKPAGLNG